MGFSPIIAFQNGIGHGRSRAALSETGWWAVSRDSVPRDGHFCGTATNRQVGLPPLRATIRPERATSNGALTRGGLRRDNQFNQLECDHVDFAARVPAEDQGQSANALCR